ncbi:MAG: hypothetical protein FWG14_06545 [Peptococcaceae bacterium]|nr:hypothetical protein [Peptococcaceae bacterium]
MFDGLDQVAAFVEGVVVGVFVGFFFALDFFFVFGDLLVEFVVGVGGDVLVFAFLADFLGEVAEGVTDKAVSC